MRKGFGGSILGLSAFVLMIAGFGPANSMVAAQNGLAAIPGAEVLVPNGTHFLAQVDRELSTNRSKTNQKFGARTLEPLETTNGIILSPGAKIRGHISRIEPGGVTGRARLWLTFDDIDTPHGRLPLVAEVSSVPGDFSVREESREGEIEARTSRSTQDLEAAATGAAIGAAAGASRGGGKGAAIGAATGGIAGFMASSSIGQEIDLPKGTKLDLVLDRPLYFGR